MRLAQNILLIDGECMLCQRITQFVVRHDKQQIFMFASLQSDAGRHLLKLFGMPADYRDTFVLIQNKKHYTRSGAALRVCRKLGGAWRSLYALIVIPPILRNAVYNIVAANRYRWFGKSDQCMLPAPELRGRFIERVSELDKLL